MINIYHCIMGVEIDPVFVITVGGLFTLFMVVITIIMIFYREKFNIDEKHIMRSWNLVEVMIGIMFGFMFRGGVA